jgi:hypothetical protein
MNASGEYESKLNYCQYGFTKTKSTIANLVTFLRIVIPIVCPQGKFDSL